MEIFIDIALFSILLPLQVLLWCVVIQAINDLRKRWRDK